MQMLAIQKIQKKYFFELWCTFNVHFLFKLANLTSSNIKITTKYANVYCKCSVDFVYSAIKPCLIMTFSKYRLFTG